MNKPALLSILLILAFVISGLSQSEFHISGSPASEKKQPEWRFGWELSTKAKLTANNTAALIDSPVATYKVRFQYFSIDRDYTLETTTGFTTQGPDHDQYFNFRTEVSQRLPKHTAVTADSEFIFTGYRSLGRAGLEISKRFAREKFTLKPFTKVDYYFPLGNGFRRSPFTYNLSNQPPEKFNTGLAWSTGMASEVEFKNTLWENKTQFIYDSGAILPMRRSLFNTELMVGYRVHRLCFGPSLGYTRLLGHGSEIFPNNSIIAGMFVKYH